MAHSYTNILIHYVFSTKNREKIMTVELQATLSIAKAIQLIKGGSSKWVHDTFPNYNNFKWQEGYGAFSVSISRSKDIIAYINTQREHHHKKSFQEEYVSFLEKNVIDYDNRYVW